MYYSESDNHSFISYMKWNKNVNFCQRKGHVDTISCDLQDVLQSNYNHNKSKKWLSSITIEQPCPMTCMCMKFKDEIALY